MMTFVNLFGEGLSILATHRLVKLKDSEATGGDDCVDKVLERLLSRLEPAQAEDADLRVETRAQVHEVRFPDEVRRGRAGVAATSARSTT